MDPMSDFPSGKFERSKVLAKTGLKIGTNYARFYAKHAGRNVTAESRSELNYKNAEDLFKNFTHLRGSVLKLAQSLSMDSGVMPQEFIEVMSKAQYRVPPMNRALVRRQIHRELGKYPEAAFSKFNEKAVAAASIGQVHEATDNAGQKLAVKIQYPNIRDTIDSDLSMARTIFSPMLKTGDMDTYIDEIRNTLLSETDYRLEGKQIENFSTIYGNDPRVIMPKWLPKLSNERILTMSYINGQHLDVFLKSGPTLDHKNHFGKLLWDFIHDQIERKIYTFHADLHPGNFLFREDGRLGVLDFGCVKKFPTEFLDICVDMLSSHIKDDGSAIRDCYIAIGILNSKDITSNKSVDLFEFLRAFGKLIVKPYNFPTFDFGDSEYRAQFNNYMRESFKWRDIRVSRHFIFISKLLFGLYGMLMQLKPTIDTERSREILLHCSEERNN